MSEEERERERDRDAAADDDDAKDNDDDVNDDDENNADTNGNGGSGSGGGTRSTHTCVRACVCTCSQLILATARRGYCVSQHFSTLHTHSGFRLVVVADCSKRTPLERVVYKHNVATPSNVNESLSRANNLKVLKGQVGGVVQPYDGCAVQLERDNG